MLHIILNINIHIDSDLTKRIALERNIVAVATDSIGLGNLDKNLF